MYRPKNPVAPKTVAVYPPSEERPPETVKMGFPVLVILTSELSCCRRTDVEKLATRFKGICADSATGDRAQRSGSIVAAFNGYWYVV